MHRSTPARKAGLPSRPHFSLWMRVSAFFPVVVVDAPFPPSFFDRSHASQYSRSRASSRASSSAFLPAKVLDGRRHPLPSDRGQVAADRALIDASPDGDSPLGLAVQVQGRDLLAALEDGQLLGLGMPWHDALYGDALRHPGRSSASRSVQPPRRPGPLRQPHAGASPLAGGVRQVEKDRGGSEECSALERSAARPNTSSNSW